MSNGQNILVIGLGNPDCADDGIGPRVAHRLAGDDLGGARVIARGGDALALIEDWAGSDTVVLIDAAAVISRAGRIHRIDLATDELPCNLSLSSTHAFGMADAIGLARTLDMLPVHVIIYAVEGVCFDPGAAMSAEVAAAVDEVAERVVGELQFLRAFGASDHA
ncbi:MAG: hydrogenase maturation protease [Rhizomicrobium sp.]